MNPRFLLLLLLPLFAANAAPDYQKDIAPLLRQYCAGCHNDEDLEGDLSVEFFADVQGGMNLRPGDPDKSQLIRLMTGQSDEPMPPTDEPQPSEAEIAVFRAWIAAGAKGPTGEDDISILSSLDVPKIASAPARTAITAVAQASDGARAIARFSQIELTRNGKVKALGDLPGKVNALHFSKDGKQLIAASGITGLNGIATVFDLATGNPILEMGDGYHRDVLYDAEFSPDGKHIATAGYDAKIAIWERATGKRLRTIEVHNGAIFDLAFSPDGSVLASASGDSTVKVWRVDSGMRLDTLNQPQAEQFSVEFTPDGKHIIAGGADNRIRMWRFISRSKPQINPLIHARFAHEDAVVKIAISADGKNLISSGDDRAIKQWSLPRLEQVRAWENQPDVAAALSWEQEKLLVARMDGSLATFSLATPKPRQGVAEGAIESSPTQVSKAPVMLQEVEPNNAPTEAMSAQGLPAQIKGLIGEAGDSDHFWFRAEQGQSWVFEVNAARRKSKLDSKVEILHASGEPVERVKLQAVRDSWFTFRGKDSDTSNDFRVHNWREMELNEYLYSNGEVVKLWLYPRGPDSGFKVYPGIGKRRSYFGTTALSHALGQPATIVEPIPAGYEPAPNGLPVYTILYENDDDSERHLGSDSRLDFVAPETGDYVVRVSDVRGFGGSDYHYTLNIRQPKPEFKVTVTEAENPVVNRGSGKEFTFKVDRFDDFMGEIRIDITGLPPGFSATNPIIIEENQHTASGVLFANADATAPATDQAKMAKLIATATLDGRKVTREVGTFGEIKLGDPAPITIVIQAKNNVIEIRPGETVTAKVLANRGEFKDRITLGKEDSGRNFQHGLYVDNIGLSGLMLPEGVSERTFFITAAPWVQPSERFVHLRADQGGKQATRPVKLRVLPAE